MKKSISLLLLSLLMITPSCQKTKEAANEYNIVPKPNQILPQEGRFELNNKVCLVVLSDAPEVKSIADSLAEQLKLTAGISLKEAESADGKRRSLLLYRKVCRKKVINYRHSQSHYTHRFPAKRSFMECDSLSVTPSGNYGKQLDKKADWSVPAVEIEDSPRFVHADSCWMYAAIMYR